MSSSKDIKLLIKPIALYTMTMAIVALAIGVVYREVSKAFLSTYPLETQITVAFYLSLCHGHIFFVGVLLPVALLAVTYIVSREYGLTEETTLSLKKAFTVFAIGSILMLALLVYKGLSIVYYYSQNPGTGLSWADNQLFLGSHILRESIYGIAHLLLGIGLTWYAVSIIRSLQSK